MTGWIDGWTDQLADGHIKFKSVVHATKKFYFPPVKGKICSLSLIYVPLHTLNQYLFSARAEKKQNYDDTKQNQFTYKTEVPILCKIVRLYHMVYPYCTAKA